jgi:hypothetical protein
VKSVGEAQVNSSANTLRGTEQSCEDGHLEWRDAKVQESEKEYEKDDPRSETIHGVRAIVGCSGRAGGKNSDRVLGGGP